MSEVEDWTMAQAALHEMFEAAHPFTQIEAVGIDRTLRVLVAQTEEQRARGMIGRRFDGFDAMMFVFDHEATVRFHNRGVDEALTIAFYDSDGQLVDLQHMEAGAGEIVSAKPARYALELPAHCGAPSDRRILDWAAEAADTTTIKKTAEDVNLRPADPTSEESCPNCIFFISAGLCELVDGGAKLGMVSDEFTERS